ncbi:hypothetical protein [Jatrophihabitans sp.]|uniref:hypothetical protein n=1 Tax=Jatrophihabitans sp. TaxID=1932789 RepID=UPI0030C74E8B|nr:hypothetical protein [Jatrophihabitans sp.]
MSAEPYVTNSAWLEPVGRPDAIDEIADQFERPAERGLEAFWWSIELHHSAPAREAAASFVPRTIERRAG